MRLPSRNAILLSLASLLAAAGWIGALSWEPSTPRAAPPPSLGDGPDLAQALADLHAAIASRAVALKPKAQQSQEVFASGAVADRAVPSFAPRLIAETGVLATQLAGHPALVVRYEGEGLAFEVASFRATPRSLPRDAGLFAHQGLREWGMTRTAGDTELHLVALSQDDRMVFFIGEAPTGKLADLTSHVPVNP